MPLTPPPRLERLGGARLTAAATTLSLTVPARDLLIIEGFVPSTSAADAIGLRFNNTATNATGYWWRTLEAAAGAATLTNVQAPSTNMIRLHNTTSALGRLFRVEVSNRLATSKTVVSRCTFGTGAEATVGALCMGGGEYIATAAQITTVTLATAGGTATLGVDTVFAVFGSNA